MLTSRITAPLAALLTAAALASPAAAATQNTTASRLPGPPTWPTNPQPITQDQTTASRLPGPPTWPTNPQPITHYHAATAPVNGGLDWDSAGLGAAAAFAALGAGLASIAGLRRRRTGRTRSLTTS